MAIDSALFTRSSQLIKRDLYSGTKTDGNVLPDGYADTAKTIAQRRIVLAGYRLAAYLKATF